MHPHIQAIEKSVQSIREIEGAFWGSRHPSWSGVEKFDKERVTTYRVKFAAPIPRERLGGDGARGRVAFLWELKVDWARPTELEHEFLTRFYDGKRRQVMVDYLYLRAGSILLRRDDKRGDACPRDAPAFVVWQRRYGEALAALNVRLPETFENPQRPVETYSSNDPRWQGLRNFTSAIGCCILDELVGVPLPLGV